MSLVALRYTSSFPTKHVFLPTSPLVNKLELILPHISGVKKRMRITKLLQFFTSGLITYSISPIYPQRNMKKYLGVSRLLSAHPLYNLVLLCC